MRYGRARHLEYDMTNALAKSDHAVHMPSDVSGRLGFFDRFATVASAFASRQLIINTATTIRHRPTLLDIPV
ncbi:hypothetical protein [Kribbella solani]|uniref:hypothetical protein n=1 Tax=Kribbella solani TaxID=236067 RepID=UPI0029A4BE61|nr:hypothetical protein [Kribbella solani]MDX2968575.1 hypothetical protein [Kribbella solani]